MASELRKPVKIELASKRALAMTKLEFFGEYDVQN
jgi:hypothetical protein